MSHRNRQIMEMKQKFGTHKASSEQVAKDIRRATRRQYSVEKKIRVVLDGLLGSSTGFGAFRL